ncbi:MAG: PQQ-dependent sugar dehydrogenase [Bacteroidetes bacterium]|nr:PQQ-dependent sugar dehydrogenase [Bacteroidota bacterium]
MRFIVFTAFAIALFLSACQPKKPAYNGVLVESEKQKFGIDTISKEFFNPWGMTFLPDGRTLITERSGVIRVVQDGVLLKDSVKGVPTVLNQGQGGLMDIQLHPDYATNGWIYFTYSKPGPDSTSATTLARAKINGLELTDVADIFSAQPFFKSDYHFGSRIAFDGKGHVFISSGERGEKPNSQNLGNHLGKILRLNDDGTVPSDNPFVTVADAKPEIWSYGHRNPQGLWYDAESGRLWDAEHGPMGGDELNLVEPGKNYGWPVITYGMNYDSTVISDLTEKEGMEQPVRFWKPSIATCGLMMVTSDKYPGWKGNFLVTALAQMHIARVEMDGAKYVREERLLDKIGRIRYAAQSPDGIIYVLSEGPGSLVRLIPVSE